MSDTVVHLDNDKYNEVVRLLDQARACQTASKSPRLKLAQKLALQQRAKNLREQAMAIR